MNKLGRLLLFGLGLGAVVAFAERFNCGTTRVRVLRTSKSSTPLQRRFQSEEG
jgi:hypothetical protein